MNTLVRALLAIAALGIGGSLAFSQPSRAQPYYAVKRDVTLSSASSAVTVQQPATGSRVAQFVNAYVYCAVACEITIERNGAAASSTAATIDRHNPETTVASAAQAFHTSNVGAASSSIGPILLAAGGGQVLDLSSYQMRGDGTGSNLTVRTNVISGRVVIIIRWMEF